MKKTTIAILLVIVVFILKLQSKKSVKTYDISVYGFCLWSHLESNQAPTDYESVALTE